ncbi:GDP-mannose 4,6-dehydratase, partial [Phocicoccus schoeneichii]|uniref:GDP-mannose 4,6-dehydratase n=1 Tax=Phocicoccus schoeneichii TaxID=1812261 RepID=UPI003D10EDD4
MLKLIEENHEVVILDNISNSKKDRLKKLRTLTNTYIDFYEVDILDTYKLMEVFQYERFDAVLHFAALKYVGESFEIPLEYYETNV